MRILLLNQYFHPDRSSTSQLLTELCEDLALEHEVFVVTGRPSYEPQYPVRSRGLVSEEHHRRVRIARVWSTRFDRSAGMAGRLANYATYLPSSIVGALRVARPDVVVAMTDPPVVAAAAAAVGAIRRIPFVYVSQDVFPEVGVVLGRIRSPAVIRALSGLNRTLRKRASRVVAIGRDMQRRLLDLGCPPNKIEVIPNWADGALIRPLGDRHSVLRAEQGWDERFVVMHSGNVGLSQDLGTLIEAADLLRDEPEVLFAIVGDGAAKARLVAEVRRRGLDNVRFLPTQPKDTLADSLGAADVHVVGLRQGLAGYIVPSKLYGILAAGRPFIAATEPEAEPARVGAEHDCAVRVDPGDPKALAQAIVDLRGTDLAGMGTRARGAFDDRFDRPVAARAYLRLLEEVAGDPA